MHILFIKQLMGAEIIKSICWTLLHSLWQGLLLAIAGALIIVCTRKRRPAIRYNFLSILFLLFVITCACTFIIQINHAGSQHLFSAIITEKNNQLDLNPSWNSHQTSSNIISRLFTSFTNYFDSNAPLIVVAWFIILSARLLKMFTGLAYINKIRHRQINTPIQYWKNSLRRLQITLQIKKPIQLLESGIIKIPMAIGWLKPVILIPAGLFTHLSEEQVEAILLHELAHIKRRDYFVNLLQSLAETVFFFNPAVLWVSSLIREERENCCDDMAIGITQNKTKFINALVCFQEYNNTDYVMAFPGRKNQLLKRVQRILYSTNNTLNQIEKASIISCCLVVILLCAFIIPEQSKSLIKKIPGIKTVLVNVTPDSNPIATQGNNQRIIESADQHKHNKIFSRKSIHTNTTGRIVKESIINNIDLAGYKKTFVASADTIPLIKVITNVNKVNTKLTLNNSVRLNTEVILNTNIILHETNVKLAPLKKIPTRISVLKNYDLHYTISSQDSSYINHPHNPDSSR